MAETNSKNSEHDGLRELAENISVEQCPLDDSDLPIHKAAYKGEHSILASLVAFCESIDVRNHYECTPLHLAIRGNHGEGVRLLLAAGANPALEDTVDSALQRPFDAISLAARVGSQHAMAALIEYGLKVPANLLSLSASLNHVECMCTILDKLSQNDFCDSLRLDGARAALEPAACCWHLEAVEYLLTCVGGFPDKSTTQDRAALGFALCCAVDLEYLCDDNCRWVTTGEPRRFPLILEKLVAAGADVNAEHPRSRDTAFWISQGDRYVARFLLDNGLRLDSRSEGGFTPLFGVIVDQIDDTSLVEAFIAAGASVKATDAKLGTPLHFAAHRAFAELLCNHGADLFARDAFGRTPLHTACRDGRRDVAEFLISKGTAVDETTTEANWTSLLFATSEKENENCSSPPNQCPVYSGPSTRLEVTKLLLAHGADVRATATDGRTALHGAARLGDAELVHYLIEQGADVRAVTADGETALHSAAYLGDAELTRYLIHQGADVCAVTADGKTPLHSACSKSSILTVSLVSSIASMLIENGADVNAKDKTGATPLYTLYDRCYRYWNCSPDGFNEMLRRGADRLATDNEGKTVLDLIDPDKWVWNEAGMLRAKPPPRATYSRGPRGRGSWFRGRGACRGS
ncbi:Nn.00g029370.m01.CDS01 [Neocucurbitaria sp. VM-36]